jgi:hypothetical protein
VPHLVPPNTSTAEDSFYLLPTVHSKCAEVTLQLSAPGGPPSQAPQIPHRQDPNMRILQFLGVFESLSLSLSFLCLSVTYKLLLLPRSTTQPCPRPFYQFASVTLVPSAPLPVFTWHFLPEALFPSSLDHLAHTCSPFNWQAMNHPSLP